MANTKRLRSFARSKSLLSLCLLVASTGGLRAEYGRVVSRKGVGIEQKLNTAIPLGLTFRDEANRTVPLRMYFGEKPVVLAMVYYKCPGLCSLTMNEMVHSLARVDLNPGQDYNVVLVSIDPAEKPALAAAKKASYAKLFTKPGFAEGWHFLTGDQDAISKLAAAVGFHYHWDGPTQQFVHAAGIMVATPAGKLSRYLYGIQYAPTDLRLALVEASAQKIGSPVDYVLLFCCPFDPMTGKYTLGIYNVLKLAGAVTLLVLGGLVIILIRGGNRKRQATAG